MKKIWYMSVIAIAVAFCGTAWSADWQVPVDFATIQDAIDSPSVVPGDKIHVQPGYFHGAVVTKAVEIKGSGGTIINSGPLPWTFRTFMAGFLFPGDGAGSGATISHMEFETVEFPVFSRLADDVTITQCTMTNPIQGVSNWRGSGWEISHNNINDLQTANGGGIGILVGDYLGGVVIDNVISHNKINGTLHVHPNDGGGYCGTGIVLYADFRWGMPGAVEISCNRVVKNTIGMASDTPAVVDIVAIELTDTRDSSIDIVTGNLIGFNDYRDTNWTLQLTPEDLDTVNTISRNLGDNRRNDGVHPSIFGPSGN